MTATRDGVTPVVPAIPNSAIVVPLLRAGGGPLLATPLTGSMLLLRTRRRERCLAGGTRGWWPGRGIPVATGGSRWPGWESGAVAATILARRRHARAA
jgi:hypothetical protein